ncbi:MAG: hypothetical protein JWN00_4343, partial [Actinomycetia bacterium]|nr:hypothetical protein [Actinomycetes bacterium]
DEKMPDDEEELPELMTTAEVAAVFRVARSTISSWCSRGLIEHTSTPTGHLRFRRETVTRMLQEHAKPGGA